MTKIYAQDLHNKSPEIVTCVYFFQAFCGVFVVLTDLQLDQNQLNIDAINPNHNTALS